MVVLVVVFAVVFATYHNCPQEMRLFPSVSSVLAADDEEEEY